MEKVYFKPYVTSGDKERMVDGCDWLVCYVRHGASNSRKLLEYAEKREKKGLIQIENLTENM